MINIIVITSDRYRNLLPGFAYQFNKYWPETENVEIIGYKIPTQDLPSNFKFTSLGEDKGKNKWSENLKGYFNTLNKDNFLLFFEDHFLYNYPNLHLLKRSQNLIETSVDKIFCHRRIRKNKEFDADFVNINKGDILISSLCPSFWRREVFLRLLNKVCDPGLIEQQNKNLDIKAILPKNPPIIPTLDVIRHGQPNDINKVIKENNIQDIFLEDDIEIYKQYQEIFLKSK